MTQEVQLLGLACYLSHRSCCDFTLLPTIAVIMGRAQSGFCTPENTLCVQRGTLCKTSAKAQQKDGQSKPDNHTASFTYRKIPSLCCAANSSTFSHNPCKTAAKGNKSRSNTKRTPHTYTSTMWQVQMANPYILGRLWDGWVCTPSKLHTPTGSCQWHTWVGIFIWQPPLSIAEQVATEHWSRARGDMPLIC